MAQQIEQAEREWLDLWRSCPMRSRWTAPPLQVGDRACDLALQDMTGKLVHLREFQRDRRALVLVWWHYGCGRGIERALQLRDEYTDLVTAGANVVIIGPGEAKRPAAYVQQNDLPARPVVCDSS